MTGALAALFKNVLPVALTERIAPLLGIGFETGLRRCRCRWCRSWNSGRFDRCLGAAAQTDLHARTGPRTCNRGIGPRQSWVSTPLSLKTVTLLNNAPDIVVSSMRVSVALPKAPPDNPLAGLVVKAGSEPKRIRRLPVPESLSAGGVDVAALRWRHSPRTRSSRTQTVHPRANTPLPAVFSISMWVSTTLWVLISTTPSPVVFVRGCRHRYRWRCWCHRR